MSNSRGKIYIISSPHDVTIESLYLASIAEKLGFETKINKFDASEAFLKEVLSFVPDFVVMNVVFDKFKSQLECLSKMKQVLPRIKVIVSGDPFLTYNNNVTYENPFIDYAIFGEPEYALRDILDGVSDEEILGICYTDENMQAVKNEQRPYIENLDSLPMPARHLIKCNGFLTIEVSRGCPYQCFFCMASVRNGIVQRLRTPKSIVEEIEYCIKEFGTKEFYFKSDVFNFDNKWILDLCSRILEYNLKIIWSCDIIPKNMDDNLILQMYKSGCRKCNLGIESGSKDILSKLDKDITIESIENTVKLLKKYKIKFTSYFLIGLPYDTEETVNETIKFAKKLKSDKTVFNIAIPFPGSKFFVYSMLNKLFSAPPEYSDTKQKSLIKTHTLSKERVSELRDIAEKSLNEKFDFWRKISNLFKNIHNTVK